MKSRFTAFSFLVAALLLAAAQLRAQATLSSQPSSSVPPGGVLASLPPSPPSAALRGVTHAADGKPLPDVYITVHDIAHNTDRNVVSGRDGAWALVDLIAGQYTVSAIHPAFEPAPQASVSLAAAESHSLDMSLKPISHVRTFWDKLWRIKQPN